MFSASSFKKPVTHFSIPKPSSSSLVGVIRQISPATTSRTALNVESNNFDLNSAGFAVGLASLIVAIVTWVGSSLEKRLDGISTQMVTNKNELGKQLDDFDKRLEKRMDGMDNRFVVIEADIKGFYTLLLNYLRSEERRVGKEC